MQEFFIIRPDGSSIFELPYPKDFCIHCLWLLQEDGQRYKLLAAQTNLSLFACDGSKWLAVSSTLGGEGVPSL